MTIGTKSVHWPPTTPAIGRCGTSPAAAPGEEKIVDSKNAELEQQYLAPAKTCALPEPFHFVASWIFGLSMSALGQKPTFAAHKLMSAMGQKRTSTTAHSQC